MRTHRRTSIHPQGKRQIAAEHIECQPATGCDDALTYACAGDDAPMYELPDSCIPTAWLDCGPPPPIEILPCP
ncbi:MAG: hypothetical protein H6712_15180 [Myxococcales bacterium]|nr:hypothetical protein [Myxococcales bacterium]MCB9715208.1 hypothetical protein [Myxococcales bacterium]